jgi:hypothetical protein
MAFVKIFIALPVPTIEEYKDRTMKFTAAAFIAILGSANAYSSSS